MSNYGKNPPPTLGEVLFLDIETVSVVKDFTKGQSANTHFFQKKFKSKWELVAQTVGPIEAWHQLWNDNAGLNAEFGKIVNISIGRWITKSGTLYVKSLHSMDEKKILLELKTVIENPESGFRALAAHNGQDFDYPYIYRKMLMHGIVPPAMLNPFWKKPWELTDTLLDTLKIWGGTQYNHKTSLSLLAYVFGIPSPKDDMDGSMVNELYWSVADDLPFHADNPSNQKEVEVMARIGNYGNKDVVTLAKIYCVLSGHEMITDDQIKFIHWTERDAKPDESKSN